MIFNFTKIASIVTKLNCSILGRFYTGQSSSHEGVASDHPHQENQAGGMFGLLVCENEANRH